MSISQTFQGFFCRNAAIVKCNVRVVHLFNTQNNYVQKSMLRTVTLSLHFFQRKQRKFKPHLVHFKSVHLTSQLLKLHPCILYNNSKILSKTIENMIYVNLLKQQLKLQLCINYQYVVIAMVNSKQMVYKNILYALYLKYLTA